jgi:hypothetical protein
MTNCSDSYGIRGCDKAAVQWKGREAASLIEPHASRMIPEAGNVIDVPCLLNWSMLCSFCCHH